LISKKCQLPQGATQ
jgi:hypothetical protein